MPLIRNYVVKSEDGETGSDAKAFYEFKDRLMDHYWESASMVKGGLECHEVHARHGNRGDAAAVAESLTSPLKFSCGLC